MGSSFRPLAIYQPIYQSRFFTFRLPVGTGFTWAQPRSLSSVSDVILIMSGMSIAMLLEIKPSNKAALWFFFFLAGGGGWGVKRMVKWPHPAFVLSDWCEDPCIKSPFPCPASCHYDTTFQNGRFVNIAMLSHALIAVEMCIIFKVETPILFPLCHPSNIQKQSCHNLAYYFTDSRCVINWNWKTIRGADKNPQELWNNQNFSNKTTRRQVR